MFKLVVDGEVVKQHKPTRTAVDNLYSFAYSNYNKEEFTFYNLNVVKKAFVSSNTSVVALDTKNAREIKIVRE